MPWLEVIPAIQLFTQVNYQCIDLPPAPVVLLPTPPISPLPTPPIVLLPTPPTFLSEIFLSAIFQTVSKLVFYAQSTSTVISGWFSRQTECFRECLSWDTVMCAAKKICMCCLNLAARMRLVTQIVLCLLCFSRIKQYITYTCNMPRSSQVDFISGISVAA